MKHYPECSSPSHNKMTTSKDITGKDHLTQKKLFIYTDGASRGNPGEAGAGIIIYDEKGQVIKKVKKYLGTTTNNVAEYMALIIALNEAKILNGGVINLFSDSELMVRQIKGIYKVRDKKMKVLWNETRRLLSHFKHYSINCIDRRKNKEADKLANMAIDEQS